MRTMTQISLSNDVTCCHSLVAVPFCREETVDRLRALLAGQTYDDDLAVCARVDTDPIELHLFGFDAEASLGESRRIIGGLWRKPR
ncbi:MAG: hypothetical protein NTW96_25770 [Planctomycetia bacterium]|nr:hypothetical protein [Planctomycetia bacterium]